VVGVRPVKKVDEERLGLIESKIKFEINWCVRSRKDEKAKRFIVKISFNNFAPFHFKINISGKKIMFVVLKRLKGCLVEFSQQEKNNLVLPTGVEISPSL